MEKKPNRLAHETSPYLLQHALNPVDWYPWSTEALDKARREKRPIFLSIGYSACHWCHVMERESFEDVETAAILNKEFVSIKVDREERPDLDQIYMSAVQALTQHGGWPLSVFLTPDLKPFYGGTYFPPEDRHSLPSFKKVLLGLSQAWKTRRDEVVQNAGALTLALEDMQRSESSPAQTLTPDLLDNAIQILGQSFDSQFGGLGRAPKFFHSMAFRLCLRRWKATQDPVLLKMVEFTLDRIASGGIHDQIGGGFHRYSTDAEWLAPHFEKMLYDNALLAELYLEAFQATHALKYATIARSTLDYVLREMTSAEGGFFSTQDADSEGVEGKFYVWSQEEVLAVLGEELGTLFSQAYDVRPEGNWEGHSILRIKAPIPSESEEELSVARRKLLQVRSQRLWPARDEKILLSWNALMVHSFALAYQVLRDSRYLEAAQRAADFLLNTFHSPNPLPSGKLRLLHAYKDGKTRFNGYLDDYAYLLQSLITLYESDFQPRWKQEALVVADSLVEQFWDASSQAFYFTGTDHETLIHRPKETQDGATPAGQSIALTALIRLARLTGRVDLEDIANAGLSKMEPLLRAYPTGFCQALNAVDTLLAPPSEWVLSPGKDTEEWEEVLAALGKTYYPNRILELDVKGDKPAIDGKTTLYICRGYTCEAPSVGLPAIQKALREL